VGPRNHVLDVGPDLHTDLENQGISRNFVLAGKSGNCHGILIYVREFLRKMAMPISAVAFHCAWVDRIIMISGVSNPAQ